MEKEYVMIFPMPSRYFQRLLATAFREAMRGYQRGFELTKKFERNKKGTKVTPNSILDRIMTHLLYMYVETKILTYIHWECNTRNVNKGTKSEVQDSIFDHISKFQLQFATSEWNFSILQHEKYKYNVRQNYMDT